MKSDFQKIFENIPPDLVDKLTEYYFRIKQNYARAHYEPAELNGGKFCEIVFRVLEWQTQGTYTAFGHSLDMAKLARTLEGEAKHDDAIRFHIPRVLLGIYNLRNKRGVAHHAKDIDPNFMDATLIVANVDWVMAELVRLFHNVPIVEARELVQALTTKQIPIIWEVGDVKRVLTPPGVKLTVKDKALLLLYNASPESMTVNKLVIFTQYSNPSRFKSQLLKPLHKADLIHYDESQSTALLSPLGIRHVEQNLPLEFKI